MTTPSRAMNAIRCLQQLAGAGSAGASADEVARLECLEPAVAVTALEQLREAGFVTGGASRYRISRPAAEIAVGEVWVALGGAPRPATPGRSITVADLLRWESELFARETVALAA